MVWPLARKPLVKCLPVLVRMNNLQDPYQRQQLIGSTVLVHIGYDVCMFLPRLPILQRRLSGTETRNRQSGTATYSYGVRVQVLCTGSCINYLYMYEDEYRHLSYVRVLHANTEKTRRRTLHPQAPTVHINDLITCIVQVQVQVQVLNTLNTGPRYTSTTSSSTGRGFSLDIPCRPRRS
jgi:hypothetical protein